MHMRGKIHSREGKEGDGMQVIKKGTADAIIATKKGILPKNVKTKRKKTTGTDVITETTGTETDTTATGATSRIGKVIGKRGRTCD